MLYSLLCLPLARFLFACVSCATSTKIRLVASNQNMQTNTKNIRHTMCTCVHWSIGETDYRCNSYDTHCIPVGTSVFGRRGTVRQWSPKHRTSSHIQRRNFRKYPIVTSPITDSDPLKGLRKLVRSVGTKTLADKTKQWKKFYRNVEITFSRISVGHNE